MPWSSVLYQSQTQFFSAYAPSANANTLRYTHKNNILKYPEIIEITEHCFSCALCKQQIESFEFVVALFLSLSQFSCHLIFIDGLDYITTIATAVVLLLSWSFCFHFIHKPFASIVHKTQHTYITITTLAYNNIIIYNLYSVC